MQEFFFLNFSINEYKLNILEINSSSKCYIMLTLSSETDSLIESLKRELLFVNKDVLNNDIKHREELLLSGDALRSLIKMDHSLVAENTNIVVGANSCISNLEGVFI